MKLSLAVKAYTNHLIEIFLSNMFKYTPTILLLIFFLFLLLQHSIVYYSHDDWGVSKY